MTRKLPVHVNGKRAGQIVAEAGASPDDAMRLALANTAVMDSINGYTIRKVIVVPDRMVNIVTTGPNN